MFKVIEAISKDPVRLPVKPGVKLNPGNVIKVVEYNLDLVVDLCDGYSPWGLLGNKCIGGESIDLLNIAKVFPQRMIVDLSKFDIKNPINIGSSLYCNSQGILSSKIPFEGAFILAKVITPANSEKKHMSILWL